MPKVAQTTLTEFGQAVHRARGLKGWQLKDLANAMPGSSSVSFLSDIEKGKRSLSIATVGKLINALALDECWIDKFTGTEREDSNDVTPDDQIADAALAQSEKTGAAQRMRDAGISEETLIALAQKFTAQTTDIHQAWRELKVAINLAVKVQAEGTVGSNHGDFVDTVLARASELARDGEYANAGAEIDAALEQADAQVLRLLDRGVDVALLDRDTAKAAELLVRKADVEAGGMASFDVLRALHKHYFEIGRDKGNNLTSALAIELAHFVLKRTSSAGGRAKAGIDLGNALLILGQRETSTTLIEEAIVAYKTAQKLQTRKQEPRQWAQLQMNLASALVVLGERESGTASLEHAVAKYTAALEERDREREPLSWAMTKMNLGNALWAIGDRESGTKRLQQAVKAYEEALEEFTRESTPLDWGKTQMNLGNALRTIGDREGGKTQLEQAIIAFEAALMEFNRDFMPLDWASTKMNLGNALASLGERKTEIVPLEQAIGAYEAALEMWTQERAPLKWAILHSNIGSVETSMFEITKNEVHIDRAIAHVMLARKVLSKSSSAQLLQVNARVFARIQNLRSTP